LKYDRVVWDFDGVLVDSRSEAWRAASEILAMIGIKVDIQSQETFRKYFAQDGIISKADRDTLRAMHGLIMRNRTELLETNPCLALVARLNVPSEIVTSSSVALVQQVLGEQAELFVNIRGQESDKKGALVRTLARNAVFITDTIVDIKRCHDHGLTVIAVGWGYDSIVALKDSRPDFLVESSKQLASLFKELKLLRDDRNTHRE
jgi:phosphoglycolate phosphatase-like HAD superfamily hydrolase